MITQGMKLLPDYVQMENFPKQQMSMLFTAASSDTLDLLQRCLHFDPNKRISCDEALRHAYFHNAPAPTHHTLLPAKASKNSADNSRTGDHPLLSDSGVKNARRQAANGKEANRLRGNMGAGTAGGPGTAKRQLKEQEVAERKRIARKLAFGT